MRILLGYEHYPCSIARFWKRAFERLGHTVHSVGHSTGGVISWGPYDLSMWEDKPTYPLESFQNVYQIDEQLCSIARDYDLFVNVDAAHHWCGQLPIPKVIIATDAHCIDYNHQRTCYCDLFVDMHHCYGKGGVWIPYAYDPVWHYRNKNFAKDVYDVCFIGVEYTERTQDLDMLSRHFRVFRGTGIVFDEGVPYYSASHVAYCRPSQQDLPTRFFEAMAYGCIPVITSVPDLQLFDDLIKGWHYETFGAGSNASLVDAVSRVIQDPRLAERKASVLGVVKNHSWDVRAKTLIDACIEKGLVNG